MAAFKAALLLGLFALISRSEARLGSPSSPQDLFANPKYAVEFYNERPVAKSDAARWLQGGERTEGWGETSEDQEGSLVQLQLSPPSASSGPQTYLCLLPPAPTASPTSKRADITPAHEEHRVDPIKGWQALSHLEGKCIYSKQGWFTYAYCHNSHIRQFRAAKHSPPHPPSGYIPEEDGEHEAYTLGRVVGPSSNQPSRRTATETPALSYGHSHSSRYLLQRLTSGTICDKTGRARETEVQFHCSMTHADSIYLVKELATCSYVLVIHSPHLCELPGFKPATATGAVERVKCRLVVGDNDVVSGHDQGQASTKPVGRETRQPALAAAPAVDPIPESNTQLSRSEAALERLIELLHLAPDSQSELEITSLLEDAIGGEFVSDEERDPVAEGSKLELLRSLLATLGAEVEIRVHDEHHDQEEDEERSRDEL